MTRGEKEGVMKALVNAPSLSPSLNLYIFLKLFLHIFDFWRREYLSSAVQRGTNLPSRRCC